MAVAPDKRQSILVVEDEGVVAEDLQHRLAGLGYEVAGWATSGDDAMRLAEETRPSLILMDIRIRGGVDGIAAAHAIRERCDIPVIFVTAFADADTLARAKVVGPLGYIVKPFSDRDLETSIELALYKHQTDRQRAELLVRLQQANAELDEKSGFLSALFESAPFSVAVFDGQLRVRMANGFFKQIFRGGAAVEIDVRAGEVLRCSHALANPGQCGTLEDCLGCFIRDPILGALEGRATTRQRCALDHRDQGIARRMTLLVSATPIRFKDEAMAMVILEDITELSGLRSLLKTERSFAGIVGTTPTMVEIFNTIREVADVNVPVLVLGESGTGKELVARAIHSEGSRASRPFVPVNCGALPDGLLESELFGHVKGAFTGAVRDRKGRFELADTGTIFLDEIGDLSPTMQVKLLRVLQEGSFERVGGEKTVTVDVRVVCATNKQLSREVEAGRFRDDLYYRLAVVPITVPPLRERVEDLPLIAEHILAREAAAAGGRRVTLSPEVIGALLAHDWPGNIRELQNALQFAFIKCKGDTIGIDHLPPGMRKARLEAAAARRAPVALTAEAIARALREAGGNRTRAAELLGVSRATFYRHLGSGDR
ncbi:MAG TPA: sigma 54-interacting transcriptional regulator [Thermoanaerobaculales bacterium]|nr:sigma 54-interacting transcriptional regulator [Thermoanaerobaculales bacterium]HQL31257.1 sigma 54-interacting transcriptional regulator [Thermoanaerobaculales bacterium]HQN94732.1 sigma 54-interacting transcriptional regulator [Thermoanaerobaculales bacterium]HQP44094.1 sigma 54-interacting transcriptional regulator [Thermoanaerobaculales bacterium]